MSTIVENHHKIAKHVDISIHLDAFMGGARTYFYKFSIKNQKMAKTKQAV